MDDETFAEQLTRQVRELAAAARAISAELATERSRRRRDFRVLAGLVALVLLVAGPSAVLLVQSRQRGLENRQVLQQITDCTTPGRPCYDAGQKRTAGVIQVLIDAQVVIAGCARDTTTDQQLQACVRGKTGAP